MYEKYAVEVRVISVKELQRYRYAVDDIQRYHLGAYDSETLPGYQFVCRSVSVSVCSVAFVLCVVCLCLCLCWCASRVHMAMQSQDLMDFFARVHDVQLLTLDCRVQVHVASTGSNAVARPDECTFARVYNIRLLVGEEEGRGPHAALVLDDLSDTTGGLSAKVYPYDC